MAREDDGIKNIEKELNKLARKNVRAAKSAVSAGAQIYADGLEKNTPRGRGDQDPHKTHMKDNVVYLKPREDGEIYSNVDTERKQRQGCTFQTSGQSNSDLSTLWRGR
ncbi:hypothetical protein BSHJ18_00001 [Bacillus velezensis]|nr:hypothetical protein BSHJ18_00001 [Bacillus velezensis]